MLTIFCSYFPIESIKYFMENNPFLPVYNEQGVCGCVCVVIGRGSNKDRNSLFTYVKTKQDIVYFVTSFLEIFWFWFFSNFLMSYVSLALVLIFCLILCWYMLCLTRKFKHSDKGHDLMRYLTTLQFKFVLWRLTTIWNR